MLVTPDIHAELAAALRSCTNALQANDANSHGICESAMDRCVSSSGIANVYNIKAACPEPPLCYLYSVVSKLVNRADVKLVLGVPPQQQWQPCNFQMSDELMNHMAAHRLHRVLAANKVGTADASVS